MAKTKEITIYGIAGKLKVSVAALNGGLKQDDVTRKKTRKRIAGRAEKVGYALSHFTHNLWQKQNNTPGNIVTGICLNEIAVKYLINHSTGIRKISPVNTINFRTDLIVRKSSLKKALFL